MTVSSQCSSSCFIVFPNIRSFAEREREKNQCLFVLCLNRGEQFELHSLLSSVGRRRRARRSKLFSKASKRVHWPLFYHRLCSYFFPTSVADDVDRRKKLAKKRPRPAECSGGGYPSSSPLTNSSRLCTLCTATKYEHESKETELTFWSFLFAE